MPTSQGDPKLPLMTLPKPCKGGNKERSSRSANNGAPVDFLPDDLLSTLNSSSKKYDDLGPGSKKKAQGKRPVDSLWQHANTRSKFKHLTEQPLCTCGAGK